MGQEVHVLLMKMMKRMRDPPPPVWSWPPQYTTSYTVAFLSPEPVTMYLSSGETSQLSTDEDSLD